MSEKKHVLISANPKSGSQSRLQLVTDLQRALHALGFECELLTDLDVVAGRAKELSNQNKLRTVVAAGGDGTASTVAALIPQDLPITLFPTGSENLLAKYLSCDADIDRCAHSIRRGTIRKLDAMLVNNKLVLLMASIGFDADVVRRVHQSRMSHVSRWNYWTAIIRSLLQYQWPTLHIEVLDDNDQCLESFDGSWVFVFNVPKYAAGLSIIHDAYDNDGWLDVGVFSPGGLLHGLRCYWKVRCGVHHRMHEWRRFKARSLRIRANGQASCQTDGDWVGWTPTRIGINPQQVTFFV